MVCCLLLEWSVTTSFYQSSANHVSFCFCETYSTLSLLIWKLWNFFALIIHPLTIMECTLDRPQYMGLSYKDAFEYSKKMISAVHEHNGELVLLWHNINPKNNWYYSLYEAVLKDISGNI